MLFRSVKHYVTEVYADKASFCGGKNESGGTSRPAQPARNQQTASPIPADLSDFEEAGSGDDLPF